MQDAGEHKENKEREERDDDGISTVLTGVGPRLRALRQQRGTTTLAQLSETTGLSPSTLSRLECGCM